MWAVHQACSDAIVVAVSLLFMYGVGGLGTDSDTLCLLFCAEWAAWTFLYETLFEVLGMRLFVWDGCWTKARMALF